VEKSRVVSRWPPGEQNEQETSVEGETHDWNRNPRLSLVRDLLFA